MSTVTIPRELAQSLLVLMTRSVTEGSHGVPPGQWLTFANALDRAMHPRTQWRAPNGAPLTDRHNLNPPEAMYRAMGCTPELPQVASGATQAPSPTPGACRFCRVTLSEDQGLCATCASELLHDAQQLEQSRHADCPCSRCQQ